MTDAISAFAVNNLANQLLLGLLFCSIAKEDLLQICSTLQQILDSEGDTLLKQSAARALQFVSSLPKPEEPRDMRDFLKVIKGGKDS